MKFHQLLAFSAAALAWDFKLAILAPEAIRDTIVGSGKVSDIDGEIEPLTRETQDPDSLSVCLDEAGMYTHEANPACDFGEPVSGVFKLYFTQPTDEPRPFNVTIGDDPTVMMVSALTGYKAHIDVAVPSHGR
jgi:hypothetical protein